MADILMLLCLKRKCELSTLPYTLLKPTRKMRKQLSTMLVLVFWNLVQKLNQNKFLAGIVHLYLCSWVIFLYVIFYTILCKANLLYILNFESKCLILHRYFGARALDIVLHWGLEFPRSLTLLWRHESWECARFCEYTFWKLSDMVFQRKFLALSDSLLRLMLSKKSLKLNDEILDLALLNFKTNLGFFVVR